MNEFERFTKQLIEQKKNEQKYKNWNNTLSIISVCHSKFYN